MKMQNPESPQNFHNLILLFKTRYYNTKSLKVKITKKKTKAIWVIFFVQLGVAQARLSIYMTVRNYYLKEVFISYQHILGKPYYLFLTVMVCYPMLWWGLSSVQTLTSIIPVYLSDNC